MGRGEKEPDGDFRVGGGIFLKTQQYQQSFEGRGQLSIAELTHLHTQRKKKGQRKSYRRTDGECCLFFLLCAVGIDREGLYGHAGFRGAGGCGAH